MALTRFGFIVTGAGLNVAQHRSVMTSGQFKMIALGVSNAHEGIAAAQQLVAENVQLIELCGGFGPQGTAAVIAAISGAVPVGSVGYGPEATQALADLFA